MSAPHPQPTGKPAVAEQAVEAATDQAAAAQPQTAPVSLLLPVYHGDNAAWLRQALNSCLTGELLPAEVVIVRDGPVGAQLQAELAAVPAQSPVPVRVVELPTNGGLATALNAGLAACSYDFVARMDADDVSCPERLARQWQRIQADGLELIGSGMAEFHSDPDSVMGYRVPPVGAKRIRAHARTHNPFNHPTVCYSKAAVLRVGGYREMGSMEDYWLMVRLLDAGVRADNIAEPLVKYRVGSGVYQRRGGLKTARTELRLQREMLRIGFISRAEFVRNSVLKTGYRLLPAKLKQLLFGRLVAGGLPGDKRAAVAKNQ